MRRIVSSSALALLMAVGLSAQPAQAQSYDNRALYDRIDRLERDLSIMQRDAARGGSGAGGSRATVIQSPALGGGSSAPAYGGGSDAQMSPAMASRLDERVDQLEDMLRQLTGKVEEANFKAAQAEKKLERLQADLDLRFKDLAEAQAKAGAAAPAAPAQTQGISMPAAKGGASVGANSADGTGPAPGPQVLGSMPEKDLKKALGQPAAATPPAAAAKDPKDQYEDAYALAQKGDFAGAEKGFEDFLAKNPKHQLAGNAQFWLADIAYTRKDYKTAASQFADAYKKFPSHSKAPDMLYKLGSSFGNLGMGKEACKAFALLFAEHPDMPDRVKRQATADKQKYACK